MREGSASAEKRDSKYMLEKDSSLLHAILAPSGDGREPDDEYGRISVVDCPHTRGLARTLLGKNVPELENGTKLPGPSRHRCRQSRHEDFEDLLGH